MHLATAPPAHSYAYGCEPACCLARNGCPPPPAYGTVTPARAPLPLPAQSSRTAGPLLIVTHGLRAARCCLYGASSCSRRALAKHAPRRGAPPGPPCLDAAWALACSLLTLSLRRMRWPGPAAASPSWWLHRTDEKASGPMPACLQSHLRWRHWPRAAPGCPSGGGSGQQLTAVPDCSCNPVCADAGSYGLTAGHPTTWGTVQWVAPSLLYRVPPPFPMRRPVSSTPVPYAACPQARWCAGGALPCRVVCSECFCRSHTCHGW